LKIIFFQRCRAITGGGKARKTIHEKNEKWMFRALINLLEESDEGTFNKKLDGFLKKLLEKKENKVHKYVSDYWKKHRKLWAHCYRPSKWPLNTNNVVEAFHRVLKICFFLKMKVRRIEELIGKLVEFEQEMYRKVRRQDLLLSKAEV
jgi:hypothetical protein